MHSSLTCYHWSCFCFCLWHCSEICHCSVTVIDIVIMKSSYPTWNEHPHLKSAVIVPSRPLPPKLVILSTSLLVAGHPATSSRDSFVCCFFFSCFYVTLVSSSPVVPRCHFIDRTCRRWRLPARPGSSSYYAKQAAPTSNRHGWPSLTRPRRTGTEDRRRLGTAPSCLRCVATGSSTELSSSSSSLLQKLTRRWISNCNSLQSEGKLRLCKRSRWSQMFQQSSRLFEILSSGLVGRLWGLLWVRLHEVWKWNYMKTDVLLWSQSLTPHDPWALDVPGTQINEHYT